MCVWGGGGRGGEGAGGTYLEKQCAAVRTHRSVMRLPPQKWLPFRWMLTCHGHSPSKASCPPTIRFSILGRPQTRGTQPGQHSLGGWFHQLITYPNPTFQLPLSAQSWGLPVPDLLGDLGQVRGLGIRSASDTGIPFQALGKDPTPLGLKHLTHETVTP